MDLKKRKSSEQGQALMEFTLVLPLVTLLMMAAFMVGAAMYTGANASSALRSSVEDKFLYADSDTAVTDLTTKINSYDMGTFQLQGSNVDVVTITNVAGETPIIVAQKSIKYPLFPTFSFVVTQSVPGDLLRNNTDPFNLNTDLVYDPLEPQTANSIDPFVDEIIIATDVPPVVPFVGVLGECTPIAGAMAVPAASSPCELSPYLEAAGCGVVHGDSLLARHIAPMTNLNACNAASNVFWRPTDVVFDATPPTY